MQDKGFPIYRYHCLSLKYENLYWEILNRPEGIVEYNAMEILGWPMGLVGAHMQEFQVLNYHPKPPGRFTFRNRAMEMAVKEVLAHRQNGIGGRN